MRVNAKSYHKCSRNIALTTYSTLEPNPASNLAATSNPLPLAKPQVIFQTTYQDEHSSQTVLRPNTSVKGARIIGPNAKASTKIESDMFAVSGLVLKS